MTKNIIYNNIIKKYVTQKELWVQVFIYQSFTNRFDFNSNLCFAVVTANFWLNKPHNESFKYNKLNMSCIDKTTNVVCRNNEIKPNMTKFF